MFVDILREFFNETVLTYIVTFSSFHPQTINKIIMTQNLDRVINFVITRVNLFHLSFQSFF